MASESFVVVGRCRGRSMELARLGRSGQRASGAVRGGRGTGEGGDGATGLAGAGLGLVCGLLLPVVLAPALVLAGWLDEARKLASRRQGGKLDCHWSDGGCSSSWLAGACQWWQRWCAGGAFLAQAYGTRVLRTGNQEESRPSLAVPAGRCRWTWGIGHWPRSLQRVSPPPSPVCWPASASGRP
jgi:hypothetical protein